MGATHGDPTTYPRLGSVIGFVPPERLPAVAENVIAVQRDWGNRSERKHARLKYTLDHRGFGAFVAELESRLGFAFEAARPFHFDHNGDRYGWILGHDQRWHLTLHIEAGRLADRTDQSLLSGLREIAKNTHGRFSPDLQPESDRRRRCRRCAPADRCAGRTAWPGRLPQAERHPSPRAGLRCAANLRPGYG